mmetsp:Transcript_27565/g.51483  ORF Transcript_27565/g.51483 Transcript_27565/m.51483 type:complete len:684 (+) Transcript_27565:108-2159(+)
MSNINKEDEKDGAATTTESSLPPEENEASLMKEHRRVELLAIARKSRLRWILEAREKKVDYSVNSSANKNNTSSTSKTDFYNKVPAASCLQEIVDFLVDMTISGTDDDKEYIDIETLAPSDNLDDELMDLSVEDLPNYNKVSELSAYSIFLEKLKHSSSTEIVNMLRKFVTKIQVFVRDNDYNAHNVTIKPTVLATTTTVSTSATDVKLDIPQEIIEFMSQVEQILRQHVLWSSEPPDEFKKTIDSLEKFLFHKLHSCLFPQVIKKNLDKDEMLRERIESLAFLDPEHLDMVPLKKNPPNREESFQLLKRKLKIKENELVNASNVEMKTLNVNMMNVHTEGLTEAVYLLKYSLSTECLSPSDMMDCLKDVAQSAIETISANQVNKKKAKSNNAASLVGLVTASPPQNNKKAPPGADDLLPALILAIKEANPANFSSTISYLETYLPPKKLFSEAGFILTQFVSAVQFLEHVNANALTISPLEFEESMYKCKHGGASRMRILEEENELREKLMYKKKQGQSAPGAANSTSTGHGSKKGGEARSAGTTCDIHEVYKRIKSSHARDEDLQTTLTVDNSLSSRDPANDDSSSIRFKRINQALITAHKAYRASDVQNQAIAIWSQAGDSGTKDFKSGIGVNIDEELSGLINFYDKSADMLTMKDIPRIMAEYRMLVRACAATLTEKAS